MKLIGVIFQEQVLLLLFPLENLQMNHQQVCFLINKRVFFLFLFRGFLTLLAWKYSKILDVLSVGDPVRSEIHKDGALDTRLPAVIIATPNLDGRDPLKPQNFYCPYYLTTTDKVELFLDPQIQNLKNPPTAYFDFVGEYLEYPADLWQASLMAMITDWQKITRPIPGLQLMNELLLPLHCSDIHYSNRQT